MTYEFGPFRYDSDQRLLFRGGERVPLVPKVADTLHVLIERRGQVIDKAELMRLVWPDTTVEEVGLARNISLLRKSLDDDNDANPYIETIPRRGYRFAADVKTSEPPLAVPKPAPEPAPAIATPVATANRSTRLWFALAAVAALTAAFGYYQFFVPSKFLTAQADGAAARASLAVVPFTCLCPNLDGERFTQGFTEVLVADLTKITGAQIVAPSTVRRHQRAGVSMGLMGRLLGLDGLVEGSIQQLDGQLRITARLVDVHTGKVIWSETYDKTAAELSTAQTATADAIAAAIRRTLTPSH